MAQDSGTYVLLSLEQEHLFEPDILIRLRIRTRRRICKRCGAVSGRLLNIVQDALVKLRGFLSLFHQDFPDMVQFSADFRIYSLVERIHKRRNLCNLEVCLIVLPMKINFVLHIVHLVSLDAFANLMEEFAVEVYGIDTLRSVFEPDVLTALVVESVYGRHVKIFLGENLHELDDEPHALPDCIRQFVDKETQDVCSLHKRRLVFLVYLFQDSKDSTLEESNLQRFFREQIEKYRKLKKEQDMDLISKEIKAIYEKMAKLKWTIYKELKKYMKVYFSEDGVFPPTFTTYHTNIKPSLDRAQLDFWYSIGLDHNPDYSQPFNLCVGWDEKIGENEGMHLSAFCGGDYKSGDHLPDIAEYDCSMIYCVYMVASTIRRIVERDIAICNKKISRAIRKSGSTKLLKVRAAVEKNLYYGYRFMSEFSGESIDMGDVTSFQNSLIKDGSLTKSCLSGIADRILETKRQIDTILHLLNDSAEFQTEKSNMALQWFMMVVTVLSLVVAVIALTGFQINLPDFWIIITKFFKYLF